MFFNLFQKKKPEPTFRDLVWVDTSAKWKGMISLLQQKQEVVVAAWFPETISLLKQQFELAGIRADVLDARHVRQGLVSGKTLILAKHYPLRSKETPLLEMDAAEVFVCSALDEPFFLHFGGERILELMKKMGVNSDEIIEHNMIRQSIKRAQDNLEEKVLLDNSAASAAAWFQKNVPAS